MVLVSFGNSVYSRKGIYKRGVSRGKRGKVMEKGKSSKRMAKIIVPLLIIAIIIIGICVWYFQFKKPYDAAVNDFNAAAEQVNEKNSELDDAISAAQAVLDAGEKPYDSQTVSSLTTAIADANAVRRDVPDLPENKDDIIKASNTLLEPLDYSDTISSLNENQAALETSIQQMKQITNPSEDFIVQRLQEIDAISGYQAVTEDHDPNGNLNKQGGYTAAIYFSSPFINQDEIYGTDIVDKGTDCGGCIEVYSSSEDAEARNEYLAAFDGAGILNSGSHTVLGTIVIRTSAKLTATQQNDLTQKITDKLLELK